MSYQKELHKVDDLCRELCRELRQLRRLISREGMLDERFGRVRDLLAALPLPSDEYAVAINRLANAERYLSSSERGAANYELQLLLGSLRKRDVAERHAFGKSR
jgi:hypothetical protein